jgi:hypothetical protein
MVRLDNQPEWARKDEIFPQAGPPDEMEDWKDFVEALAERYRGRIAAYQVWNEPNLAREWGGKHPDAAEYAEMLRVSYEAIKDADPNALVISAGMSPTTDDVSGQAQPDLAYLRELYAAGAKDSFDLLGVHAAGYKAEPEADPGDVAREPSLTNNDPSAEELKRSYAFRHVEDVRALMLQQGDADHKIAILETGWTTDTRPDSDYAWFAVSEEVKAGYLVRAIGYARQNWDYVGLMSFIYLPDPTWTPDDEQYYWSLADPDGTPRASYDAIRQVLRG